jgi:hypothetical protein
MPGDDTLQYNLPKIQDRISNRGGAPNPKAKAAATKAPSKAAVKRTRSSFAHGGAAPTVIRRGGAPAPKAKATIYEPGGGEMPSQKPKPATAANGVQQRPKAKPVRRYRVDPPGTKAKKAGGKVGNWNSGKVGNWNTGGKVVRKVGAYIYRQMVSTPRSKIREK